MKNIQRSIRFWIIFFMIALFLSGVTAIPIETELSFLSGFFKFGSPVGEWIDKVYYGFLDTNKKYPFLSYGYDWLAFAHFMLALLFIGPLRNPVRNKWVIEFGLLACVLIIPFAFIAGHFREIPIGWRLIDCSFGVLGTIPLSIVHNKIKNLEKLISKTTDHDYQDHSVAE